MKIPGTRESSENAHEHNKRGKKVKQQEPLTFNGIQYDWWKVYCTCGQYVANKTRKR